MPRVLANSRDNFLTVHGRVDIFDAYIDQPLLTTSSPTFNNLTLTGTLTTNELSLQDNLLSINTSETGAGVTAGLAGIEVERGTLTNYQIVFRESDDSACVGEVGDLQVLATREDSPLSGGVMVYNSTDKRLDSVDDIELSITFSSGENAVDSSTGALRIQGGLGVTGSAFITSGISIGDSNTPSGTLNLDGDLVLSSSTKNTIAYKAVGTGAPSVTTRSAGTKLVLYPSISGSTVDFAIGIQNEGIWNSVPSSSDGFLWYGSATEIARLDGDGVLNLHGTVASTSSTTGTLLSAGGIGISNTTDATSVTNGGTFTTAGGMSIAKKLFVGDTADFSDNILLATSNYSGGDITYHGLRVGGNTFTDSVTVTTAALNNLVNLRRTTLASLNTITTTDACTLYIEGEPIQGSNQTLTNTYSLVVDSGKSRFDGRVLVTSTTTSTTSTTGALVVSGGVGIAENLNVGGETSLAKTTVNTTTGTFSILGSGSISQMVSGSVDIVSVVNDITIDAQNGDLVLDGNASVTISSANVTNGIKIGTDTSGVPITIGHTTSEVVISDNLTVNGDFLVQGVATTINSTIVTIEDNALIVNSMPNSLSDGGLLVRRYQTANNTSEGEVVADTADESSTFDTGSSTPATLVLNSSSNASSDYYRGWWIVITSGGGINQTRRIKTYNGTTKTATLYVTSETDGLDLVTAPVSGDTYSLYSGTYSGSFYDDTNDEWVLGKVPYDSGAGVFPLIDYQDLHIKNLTVSGISGLVSSPSLTGVNLTNTGSVTPTNVTITKMDTKRTLSGCFRVTPTVSVTVTSFEFVLPEVTSNWSNSYDITVNVNGHHDNTNFYSVENLVGYAVASSTRAKIKFTSGSTGEHVIHFVINYAV